MFIVYNIFMNKLEIDAHAKINLSLDVLFKREDNYHELRTIIQTIELHDTVSFEVAGSSIDVACDSKWVPAGCGNIAYKAAIVITEKYGLKCGIKINIHKRIPVAAGLAGGSTDAAAVLKGIDRLFHLGLTIQELCVMGRLVGADVPYCIKGGTMLAEGTGEILTPLEPFSGVDVILLKPKVGVSTAWVYGSLDLNRLGERPDTQYMKAALAKGDIKAIACSMRNVLESVTIPRYPVVGRARARLMELGALGSMMSGSGPTVFGLFTERETALKAYREVSDSAEWDCFLTYTVSIPDKLK